MRFPYPLTRNWMLCLAALSCAPGTGSDTSTQTGPSATLAQAATATKALYDAQLAAPACRLPGAACDSDTTLTGRGTVGPESKAPNTLGGSCADGDDGAFHAEASVDALRVSSVDGVTSLAEGRTVKVEADVWGAPSGGSALMLFQAADANAPQWVHLATLPTTGGAQTLSTTFTLPAGPLQAVRAALVDASLAQNAPCTPGAVHDHDDLAFQVSAPDTTPPTVSLSTPQDGELVREPMYLKAIAGDDIGIAQVEFYLDDTVLLGTDPGYPSSPYTYSTSWDPQTVSGGSHTLTVRAYDTSGNVTATVPVRVMVNRPPTVTLTWPFAGYRLSGTMEFTASVTGSTLVDTVSFHDETGHPLCTGFSPNYSCSRNTRDLPNGPIQVRASATDTLGNQATSAWVSYTVDNDLIPPTGTVTAPTEGATVSGWVMLSADASDDRYVGQVDFFVDGSLVGSAYTAPYSMNWPSHWTPNGPHQVSARIWDEEGNMTMSSPVNITVDHDLTPPAIAITSPAPGATLSGTVTLAANASDDRGVSSVNFILVGYRFYSDTSAPYEYSLDTRSLPNGPRTLTAEAYDSAGNVTRTSIEVTVDNDKTPPTVALTSPANGAILQGTVTLTADASDDRSGISEVTFELSNSFMGTYAFTDTTPPYEYSWNTRNMVNGTYTLRARALDGSNHLGTSTSITVTVDNDKTPPTVALSSPANGATLQGTVTLSATASDDRSAISKVEFYRDYGTLIATDTSAPYEYSLNTRTLSNGAHTLTVKAYDSTGNVGSSSTVNVTLDNDFTAPTVSITSPTTGTTLTGTVQLNASASDARSGIGWVDFYLSGILLASDTSAPYEYSLNTRNYSNGTYSLKATAYDSAGNPSSTSISVTLDNDFTAPTVSFTSPTNGATLTGMVQLNASASDARSGISRVDFYLGNTLLASDTSAPYAYDLETRYHGNGPYSLKATAYDGAGNPSTTSISVTLNNDITPPTVSITSPAANAVLNTGTQYTLTASATDNVQVTLVQFYLDGVLLGSDNVAPFELAWTNNATVGSHILRARAYDAANNSAFSLDVPVSVQTANTGTNTFTYSASNTSSAAVNTTNRSITLSAGQTLTLGTCGVTGASFSGDTYLRLYNPSGMEVAYNDDACGGAGSNFTYTVPSGAGGTYQLRAGCYSSNSCSGTVAWTINGSTTPPPPSGSTLTYSASNTSSATVNTTNRSITLSAGQRLTLGTCGVTGSAFTGDTYLRLFNPSNVEVAFNDDACGGGGSNFTYTVPSGAGGTYQLRAGCYSSGSCSGTVAWTIQ